MSLNKKVVLEKGSSAINFLESVQVSFMHQSMCKVEDFLIVLKCTLLGISINDWNKEKFDLHKRWFTDGYEAEVLDVGGSGWKKGRVKINISVEFIPDDCEEVSPESPLDDIRQSISNN
ncbi:MAG: hypothetical protein HC799_15315 [Limnothrix sp. RL_2_0]|nr:hypothetical protein [Limnothrix sp. RL_2_0]